MSRRQDKCRYCGTVAHGYGCFHSPDGIHKEVGDSDHCVMCGTTAYGFSCIWPEDKSRPVHVHGHGDGKCIYCGSTATGYGCPYSPDGKHVR